MQVLSKLDLKDVLWTYNNGIKTCVANRNAGGFIGVHFLFLESYPFTVLCTKWVYFPGKETINQYENVIQSTFHTFQNFNPVLGAAKELFYLHGVVCRWNLFIYQLSLHY